MLRADVYRPMEGGPYPVLLMRLPYGRAIASTVTYQHPSWYARQGYIVVIQDVRGCGASEGTFYPFRHEVADGYDTVRWCAQELAGSNGAVGMYGFSYQGVTQLQAAIAQPPGLVTICPAMASADLTEGWLHWGGALCWEFALTWGLQLTQNQAQFRRLEPLATQLVAAQQEIHRWLAFRPLSQMPPLRGVTQGEFFFDWLTHAPDSPYWQELSPLTHFDRFDLPALHIAGWSDLFVAGTLATYERARAVTAQPQHLIAGPWQHMPWQRRVGELDCGPAAVSSVDAWQVAWFDRWLKGVDTGIVPLTRWFVMGKNAWRESDRPWSEPPAQTWYLAGETLSATPPPHPTPRMYVSDPRNPVRSTAYGPYNQSAVDGRWDVLRYASVPLPEPLMLQGSPHLEWLAETTAPQTDWVVKLMVDFGDGARF
ncbi:MAG: CocE/NonD family hydrolase [Oscillatoriales cyanobacterium SM2_1_8]|nr:CocE/NonD family hydrolase [Oscillatoriales cyanobacterium SM2_1_8]